MMLVYSFVKNLLLDSFKIHGYTNLVAATVISI